MDTLQFLEQLCAQADAERKAGNWSKLHFIASNPAVKYYFDNVYKLGINPQAFKHSPYFGEAQAFHEAYEAQEQQTQTVTNLSKQVASLEGKLDTFINLMKPFIEAQTAETGDPEPEPDQPKARKSRKAKAEDSDTEDQDDPADEAEADADESDD